VCCSVLQCVAVSCSVAVCCSVLQCVVVCCSFLQCIAEADQCDLVLGNIVCLHVQYTIVTLQRTATHHNSFATRHDHEASSLVSLQLWYVRTHGIESSQCNALQRTAIHYNTLQHTSIQVMMHCHRFHLNRGMFEQAICTYV